MSPTSDHLSGLRLSAGAADVRRCGRPDRRESAAGDVPGMLTRVLRDWLSGGGCRETEDLAQQLLTLQEDERKRIAAELHDGIGQILSAIKLRLDGFMSEHGERLGESDRAALRGLAGLAAQAVDDLRRICMDLRPPMLDDLGVIAAVEWFCGEMGQILGPRVEMGLVVRAEEDAIPTEVKVAIFRIVQESCHNAFEHGRAARVRLCIESDAEGLRLSITDDGVGFVPKDVRRGGAGSGCPACASGPRRAAASSACSPAPAWAPASSPPGRRRIPRPDRPARRRPPAGLRRPRRTSSGISRFSPARPGLVIAWSHSSRIKLGGIRVLFAAPGTAAAAVTLVRVPGEGSTPRRPGTGRKQNPGTVPERRVSTRVNGMTIFQTLVVDDHPHFRSAVVSALRERFPGMQLAEAADGRETMRAIGSLDVDLVLMDIKLPDENGLSLTRGIKRSYAGVTVVILSALDLPQYRLAALQSGADGFLSKSADSCLSDVVARIERAMRDKLVS